MEKYCMVEGLDGGVVNTKKQKKTEKKTRVL